VPVSAAPQAAGSILPARVRFRPVCAAAHAGPAGL